ncbi:MAG: phosphatidylserine decarboxylase [Gammaproteobacteria bacterium]|nr:phosphatidylserine decarboxylase [Gammaproteobacteria bacterium]
MSTLSKQIFSTIQYCLPHHLLSRLIGKLAHCRHPYFKNWAIKTFAKHYGVDLSEAEIERIEEYSSFNAFFTRALKPNARPISSFKRAFISPADAAVSQFGRTYQGSLIQAKGFDYSVYALLGGEYRHLSEFKNGSFITLYLAPKDYHRVHMPVDGKLMAMTYVPGRLFSVNPATTETVPGLFARNERVVLFFETEFGKMALVMVGAMIVCSIETVFSGVVTPPTQKRAVHTDFAENEQLKFKAGDEIGRFQLGSTVIAVLENPDLIFNKTVGINESVRMGEALGVFS